MEETFYQPLQGHQLLSYGQRHTELSNLLLTPILSYYRRLQSPKAPRNLSLAVDVGCELGQVSERLSNFSDRVLAVDLAPEMIDLARHLNCRPNIRYEVCSADRLSTKCPGNKADIVLAAMAGHFFDTEEFYKEAEHCLRPGGVMAVVGFWSRGFLSGNVRRRRVFDRFVQRQLADNDDVEARKASAKLMSLYRHLNLPRNLVSKPVFRLHEKLELEWNRQDVAAYLFANRHILGGVCAPIEEFVASEVFDEPQLCLLHVFGWMWQV